MISKTCRVAVFLIALFTILSGLAQIISPSAILTFIGAIVSTETKQYFALIGWYMFLFGGFIGYTVYAKGNGRVAVILCALQKAGSCVSVFLAIHKGIFAQQAALIGAFDGLSAIILLFYLKYLGADDVSEE